MNYIMLHYPFFEHKINPITLDALIFCLSLLRNL